MRSFASSSAARKVQTPPAVTHTPSPLVASPASPVSFTTSVVAHGGGVGRGSAGGPPGAIFPHQVPQRLLLLVVRLSAGLRVPAYCWIVQKSTSLSGSTIV